MAKRIQLKLHWVVLLSTLGVIVMMALPPARSVIEQQKQIKAEEVKLAALLQENEYLEQRLMRLKDQDYIEKLAREQLEMVRPGEISYVVVAPERPAAEEAPPPKPKAWYEKAWEWITGWISK